MTNILLLTILLISLASLVWLIFGKDGLRLAGPAGRRAVLDTCALIDGRIVDIAKAGFVPSQLLVPRAVIRELQYMADQGDSTKRERARFGLDVIKTLQEMKNVDVRILPDNGQRLVDEQLIALAKRYGAMLYTTDYNLNKVAQTEAVTVLNVNELAQALRPHYLPGEKSRIKLVQAGNSPHQGVGYLSDGTMVVVEHAKAQIGREVTVVFTRVLQTEAGKMMFASIEGAESKRPTDKHRNARR
ncbi:MAG: hypothetical protein EOT04_02265 [Candidatus Chaera renei]|uniref:PIN domain-containing protein n=1 Tax=Candidatus Chaera renei TaxID=2506947 RepID=A0A4Q0AJ35_9BACT|nr:MAG: hypothetical protein EOT04_02265 [Candidatus Chaera renei]